MNKNFYNYCHIVSESQSIALAFSVVRKNGLEIYQCAVLDFVSREKKGAMEKKIAVRGNSGESGVSYTSKCCAFSLECEGSGKHLKCRFDTCFSHSCIEADIILESLDEFKHSGAGRYTDFVSAEGSVKTKDSEYIFSDGRDYGVFCSCDDFKKSSGYFALIGEADGKILGVASGSENGNENRIFYNGKTMRISDAGMKAPSNLAGIRHIESENGILKMDFEPFFNDRIELSSPLFRMHGDRLFGRADVAVVCDDICSEFRNLTALSEKY